MDENKGHDLPESEVSPGDPHRLTYVLLVVLIICGGNGIGIISAAIIWKITGMVAVPVALAVGITILALIGAMILIVSHTKKLGR